MPQPPNASKPLHPVSAWARFTLGFLVIILLTVPTLLGAILLLPSRKLRVRLGNLYGKAIGWTCVKLAGTRLHVRHAERLDPRRPAIYIANHASALDVWVGVYLCPVGGVGAAKKELAYVPFFGWIFALTGHLLLDRQNRTNAIAALARVGALVRKHRMSVWIWPEGTRSRDGRLLPFKKGFAHLVLATGLPIVPVVLHGTHQRWPNRTFELYPGDLEVEVLETIDTSHWKLETLDEHIAAVRAVYVEHLGPDQRPLEVAAAAV